MSTTNVIICLAKRGNINAYPSGPEGGGAVNLVSFFFNPIMINLLLFINKTKFNSLSNLKDLAFPLLQQRKCKAPIYWHMLLLQGVS